ncbi:unnamed protein product [Amoebophrya sp. A25]|nr:unnamed protein product [Amoebophrya sp. A25]|eukprot:GSA25T00012052001.1
MVLCCGRSPGKDRSAGDDDVGSAEDAARKLELLKQVPLFASFHQHELRALSSRLEVRSYQKGEWIVKDGSKKGSKAANKLASGEPDRGLDEFEDAVEMFLIDYGSAAEVAVFDEGAGEEKETALTNADVNAMLQEDKKRSQEQEGTITGDSTAAGTIASLPDGVPIGSPGTATPGDADLSKVEVVVPAPPRDSTWLKLPTRSSVVTKTLNLSAGGFFGERALLHQEGITSRRQIRVKAMSRSRCFVLSREAFREVMLDRNTKENLLRKCGVFETFDDEILAEVAGALERESYGMDEVCIEQGAKGDCMYVVEQGGCAAAMRLEDGATVDVQQYTNVGDVFGENSLIENTVRPTTIRSVTENTLLLRLDREDFERRLGSLAKLREQHFLTDPRKKLADFYSAGDARGPRGMLPLVGAGPSSSSASAGSRLNSKTAINSVSNPAQLSQAKAPGSTSAASLEVKSTEVELNSVPPGEFESQGGAASSVGAVASSAAMPLSTASAIPANASGPSVTAAEQVSVAVPFSTAASKEAPKEVEPVGEKTCWFVVYRPTSRDSIAKMLGRVGVGKGLNIKGKSAKRNRLSGFVPFLQISNNAHKAHVEVTPPNARVLVYYSSAVERTKAQEVLQGVLNDPEIAQKIPLGGRELRMLDDYAGLQDGICGLDMPELVLRHAYIEMRDISPIPEWETGRVSEPAFMDMNLHASRDPASKPRCCLFQFDTADAMNPKGLLMAYQENLVKPVVSDFDTFLIGSKVDVTARRVVGETRPAPVAPRASSPGVKTSFSPAPKRVADDGAAVDTPNPAAGDRETTSPDRDAKMAVEAGTRPLSTTSFEYQLLPADQVDLIRWSLKQTSEILELTKTNEAERAKSWTSQWLRILSRECEKGFKPRVPSYGFGDPVSVAIIAKTVEALSDCGAVRHGAECFNFYFPQELDEEYLVIFPENGNEGGFENRPWQMMSEPQLRAFLLERVQDGYSFPLNPVWPVRDPGWRDIWQALLKSREAQQGNRCWYPDSGIVDTVTELCQEYPDGYMQAVPPKPAEAEEAADEPSDGRKKKKPNKFSQPGSLIEFDGHRRSVNANAQDLIGDEMAAFAHHEMRRANERRMRVIRSQMRLMLHKHAESGLPIQS